MGVQSGNNVLYVADTPEARDKWIAALKNVGQNISDKK